MSNQMVEDIKKLWRRVQTAKEDWERYLDSLHAETSQATEELAEVSHFANGSTLAAKIESINSIKASLDARLQVLFDLQATRTRALSSSERLISRHLPSHILGTETANSILLRAFEDLDDFFKLASRGITMREQHVIRRFEALCRNHDSLLEIIEAIGNFVDAATVFRKVKLQAEAMIDEGQEFEDPEKFLDVLREGQHHSDAVAGIVERQVLKFKANAAFVGIRVARQTLITEFLEG